MATTELTGAEDVAWDLSDLYESGDDALLESDVGEAEIAAAAFRERYYGRVAELDAAELAAAIDERERIESIFTRAIYFAHLWFSTDMADAPRGALLARLTEKGAQLDTQLLFFGLELAAIAPGHGHVIEKPHDEVRRLIAHRMKREQKVIDAFARCDPATLDELLPLAYDDVPQRVHPVARRSLHAHLIKLTRDGRVSERDGMWQLQS